MKKNKPLAGYPVEDCNWCFTENLKGKEFLEHSKGELHPKCLLCRGIRHSNVESINGSHKSCHLTQVKRIKKVKTRVGRPRKITKK